MKKKIGQRKLATAATYRGSSIFDSHGQIQSGNRRDQMAMLGEVIKAMQNGDTFVTEEEATTLENLEETRRETMAALMADPKGEVAHQTAIDVAGSINLTVGKVSYMRNLLQYAPLAQGEDPQVEIQNNMVVAAIMQGPTACRLQVLNDDPGKIFPPEVILESRIYVERRRMDTSRKDVLGLAYADAVEAMTVKEDRFLKTASDVLVEARGMTVTHVGSGTPPSSVEALASKIMDFGLPVSALLLPASRLANVMYSREWEDLIEGVTRLELLRTGQLGSFFGTVLYSDAIAEKTQKVIRSDEMYAYSSPNNVGEYTDRGGIRSTPIGVAETGISGAGFHLEEALSLALPNYRAVARLRFL